ncbi:ClpP/crotonase [Daedalea quercina L-15889]|uniref:ClpP/crotonase n=1 Tax=Daedalea quercina L-15889 TaxID=1314783 RepID=A0A165PPP8_9APHY|nr:ClpP/crotonase [Daedalea quercina L-15889]
MSESSPLPGFSTEFLKISSPEPHVALVEILQCWTGLSKVFDNISREPTVRVVVLASALPRLFSAGIDLSALGGLADGLSDEPARRALQLRDQVLSFQSCITSIERCPYPVIVAAHGIAYGLSIDIMAACDVRYAASNTVFSIKEVDVGLAADIGTLARLPKIAGNHSLLHEFAYSARDFSAAEAEKLGLVSRVVQGGRDEVLTAALQTARTIATKSPIAVLGTKHLLLHARDHTVQENLDYTATWNGVMLQTADMQQLIKSMKTKTKPTFAPLGKLPFKL